MSIKIDSNLAPFAVRPTAAKPSASGFENRLQAFLAEQTSEADMARQARLQLQMSQLELARNLYTEGSDPGINALPVAGGPPLAGLAGERNLDSLSSTGKTLTETAAPPMSSRTENRLSLDGIINQAAKEHGVEPSLIRSVIRVESAFNARAVSPAGARGLMQLMPETAAELGVRDPFDAEQNVRAGTRYLRRLLDRYDGDLDHALAAYNWGMGNVDRHGLSKLPEETRNYLIRVKKA